MREIVWSVCICLFFMALNVGRATAQANEIAQLALNVEKLRQLKSILTNLERSYTILSNGYSSIKGIAEGNFSVHKMFLDGLYQVSPTVRQYRKVPEIIAYQIQLLKHLQEHKRQIRGTDLFSGAELNYVIAVYENLLKLSLKNLDELLMVMTAGQTRMSDNERLSIIDRIHSEMQDKVQFAYSFSSDANGLLLNRKRENSSLERMRVMQGLNKK